jgi:hypothetical protein
MAGSVMVALDTAENAVSSRTAVRVELPDKAQINGTLRGMALKGRTVQAGQTVRLICKVTTPPVVDTFAYCELEYPLLPPNPKSRDYYEKTGQQPSYGFPADDQGVPSHALIELERPLRWVAGVGL